MDCATLKTGIMIMAADTVFTDIMRLRTAITLPVGCLGVADLADTGNAVSGIGVNIRGCSCVDNSLAAYFCRGSASIDIVQINSGPDIFTLASLLLIMDTVTNPAVNGPVAIAVICCQARVGFNMGGNKIIMTGPAPDRKN